MEKEEVPKELLPDGEIMGMSLVGPNIFVMIGKDKIKHSVTICLFKLEAGDEDNGKALHVAVKNKYHFNPSQGRDLPIAKNFDAWLLKDDNYLAIKNPLFCEKDICLKSGFFICDLFNFTV